MEKPKIIAEGYNRLIKVTLREFNTKNQKTKKVSYCLRLFLCHQLLHKLFAYFESDQNPFYAPQLQREIYYLSKSRHFVESDFVMIR